MEGAPDRLALELTCNLGAPRDRIFRAMTEPSALSEWWGPSGFTTPEIELDLHVGGGYRFGMQPPDGELFHLAGEFIEIDPPSVLAYTFRWEEPDPDDQETLVRLSLHAIEGATHMALSQGEFATQARLTLHRNGWMDSFVKLRQLIEAAA